MASDYEKKFEDMKKYIPFLDSMILRLETCNSTDNPRQAQLNKIRALRDLLLEKNKRMKMENLNKCEQVLKNLYAKVEQSDSLISFKSVAASPSAKVENNDNSTEKSKKRSNSLNTKTQLRSICNVVQNNPEGVLFHRRPKKDASPFRSPNLTDKRRFDEESLGRRNYTRILVSPETSRVLYHRRSPKTSSRSPMKTPHKKSPSYKKSKKSSKRRSRSRKPKDINITINVPDKSLNSLNADDIIERLKKCDDNDVDLDILQGIRQQLFHELKQTGINPDITNFILQSYGNKKKKKKREKQKEYEEGELSDSESEYIERVYDNIVTDFQAKSEDFNKGKIIKTSSKTEIDSDTAVRKIKINFTIAGPNINDFPYTITKERTPTIISDSTIDAESIETSEVVIQNGKHVSSNVRASELLCKNNKIVFSQELDSTNKSEDNAKELLIMKEHVDNVVENMISNNSRGVSTNAQKQECNDKDINLAHNVSDINLINIRKQDVLETQKENKANFYKPLMDLVENSAIKVIQDSDKYKNDSCSNDFNNSEECTNDSKADDVVSVTKDESSGDNSTKIPFMSDTSKDVERKKSDDEIISHIDILAALKKDILSESLDISNKLNEVPALHQPKVIKVTGTTSISFEIDRKKRISLEKYKEKISPASKLFLKECSDDVTKEEKVKKQSRGLTAKECERFNFRKDILKDERWDECDKDDDSVVTTESDEAFAPKSPEQSSFDVLDQTKEPIIIPTESSVNSVIENSYFDTDMRVMDKGLTPKINNLPSNEESTAEMSDMPMKLAEHPANSILKSTSVDPRIKNDNLHAVSIPLLDLGECNLRTCNSNTNLLQTSLNDDNPSLNSSGHQETLKETLTQPCPPFSRIPIWESFKTFDKDLKAENKNLSSSSNTKGNFSNSSNEDRDPRKNSDLLEDARFIQDQRNQRLRNDRDPRLNLDRRSECPRTPSHYFEKSDYPQTPTHPFGRTDCPKTPTHPFGMSECPSTPIHPFGRSDCSPISVHSFPFNNKLIPSDTPYFGTPSHSFGAPEIPGTPRHSFSASDMPGTPRHPFGASEIPGTPRHPFGASEIPGTTRHPFGAPEMHDTPRHPFAAPEMPGTPCRSFGYTEIPLSPFVSFGSEMTGNSIRPFLPSDIPRTPVHPFGRADYPSYMSDCPPASNSFGRPSGNYSSEPRQNRQTDYNLSPARNEVNHYNPRRYHHQNVNRSHSDYNNEKENQTRYNREQSIGRNDFQRDQKYNRCRSQSQFRETSITRRENSIDFQRNHEGKRGRSQQRQFREATIPRTENISDLQSNRERERGSQQRHVKEAITRRRENSVGRNNSRDSTRGTSYNRELSTTNNFYSESLELRRMRDCFSQNQQRETSVVRSSNLDENSCTRDPGIRHDFESLNTRNTLDVESHAGRSFTIDTSINRTFQVINKPIRCFNDQRRRASSVGRSLNSTLRSDIRSFDHKHNEQFLDKRKNFRRSRSMGRDCELNYKIDYKDKDNFEHYKKGFEKRGNISDKVDISNCINTEFNETTSKDIKYDRHSKKEFYKKHDPRIKDFSFDSRQDGRKDFDGDFKSSSTRYNNSRDPRLQKSHFYKNGKSVESIKHRRVNEGNDISRKHEIVYKNNKTSSATVIGTSSRVKNYKIPKLKRVISDSEKNDSDDSTVSKNKDVEESNNYKSKMSENYEELGAYSGNNDKNKKNRRQHKEKQNNEPLPKESKHSLDLHDSLELHNRKTRVRKLSSDSEFEDNVYTDQNDDKEIHNLSKSAVPNSLQIQNVTDDSTAKSKEDEFAKFTTDVVNPIPQHEYDMEIFTDFTVSESAPSTEINQLIADLDKDLDNCNSLVVTKIPTDDFLQSSIQNNSAIKVQTEESLSSKVSQTSSQNENGLNVKVGKDNTNNEESENSPHKVKYFKKSTDDNLDTGKEIMVGKQDVENNSHVLLEQSPIVSSPQKDKSLVSAQINMYRADGNSATLNDEFVENKAVGIKINEMSRNDSIFEKNTLEKRKYDNITSVSTSISEKQDNSVYERDHINVLTLQSQSEAIFIPDSTVNTIEDVATSRDKTNDILPDSTNENNTALECNDKINNDLQKEADKTGNNDLDSSQNVTKINSMSNLLTILQGKSKIKELLNMLTDDESPEAEKIRRKLEKLSEIVSDEEDNEKEDIVCNNSNNVLQMQMSNEGLDSLKINEELEAVRRISTETSQSKITSFKKGYKRKIRKKTGKMKGKTQTPKSIEKAKRTTRSETAAKEQTKKSKIKKPMSRELMMLQEDIKEMFISDEVLNATGIRMCRLAKLVDDSVATKKKTDPDDVSGNKSRTRKSNDLEVIAKDFESNPLVVLEKVPNNTEKFAVKPALQKPMRKKPGPKPKAKIPVSNVITNISRVVEPETKTVKYKPGPLSKTKHLRQNDNNDFEEVNFKYASETLEYNSNSSESESETLASLKKEYNMENVQNPTAKVKRKRRHWKVCASKSMKKRKIEMTHNHDTYMDVPKQPETDSSKSLTHHIFTDKDYCFYKNQTNYACRFCDFVGSNIVHHYKYKHPHDEIPISRINPIIASEAIKQSLVTDLEAFIKISNKRHVCRFCFEIFSKGVSNLECFFWHVVSKHTGEYEQPCSLCPDEKSCSITMTKPNLPDKEDGFLLGYICGECNYTQVSMDNLKYHINKRHNNPNIKVYQISLGDITQKALSLLVKNRKIVSDTSIKTGRSLRSNTNKDVSDDKSDITETSDQISESENLNLIETEVLPTFRYKPGPASKKMQSKIRFEYEDATSDTSEIKTTDETARVEAKEDKERKYLEGRDSSINESFSNLMKKETFVLGSLFYGAHFKINVTASGVKEYICCVNGVENHYKTTLMISLKKHVQMKHKESWDGYCCICKVIVTTLGGVHKFQDCLAHFLLNHMDDFPTLKASPSNLKGPLENSQLLEHTEIHSRSCGTTEQTETAISSEAIETSKKYINVRPLSDLQHQSYEFEGQSDPEPTILRIESVVSLNPSETRKSDPALMSDSCVHLAPASTTSETPIARSNAIKSDTVGLNGEWTPSSVTDNKHRVVLETMLEYNKLVQIFKCAGKFCSFTSDSAELAVVHATTHQRMGGVGALRCTYCTFEAPGSGIDLVAHVFREHGHCQYACRRCFYRASSALLVEEHARCSHPKQAEQPLVLRAPLATPAPPVDTAIVLSRADAVPEYICTYGKKQGGPEQCKFRTYTLGKFLDHYKQRHPEVTSYECSECGTALEVSLEGSAAAMLAKHHRAHGLCQYHCTYCVFGADTERDLIAHAAHAHPAHRPQAYLRHIVESKGLDGNPKLKVLPLVHFNKGSCASLLDVEASNVIDDPVKEAARALDLEKLLGQTALMIEQAMTNNSSVSTATPVLESTSASVPGSAPQSVLAPLISELLQKDVSDASKSVNTKNNHEELKKVCSTPQPNVDDQDRVQITLMNVEAKSRTSRASSSVGPLVKIKAEPQEDVPAVISLTSSGSTAVAVASILPGQAADVICLNSDDENERGTAEVINISDNDDNSSSVVGTVLSKRIPLANVYKCANCKIVLKTCGGFKRHLSTCCPRPPLFCAYCTFQSEERDLLAEHLMRDHGPTSQYLCFYCRYTATEMRVIDRHVLTAHGIKNPVYNQDLNMKLYKKYTVRGAKSTAKLKFDKPATNVSSTILPATAARRRYGPADIDALPIAPIVDEPILCAECDFDTKVRVNMVRHLQLHAQRQPAPRTAPVNPVPYLETNEKHFDKMTNLAASSNAVRAEKSSTKDSSAPLVSVRYPQFVPERSRHVCGAPDCSYISVDETMLRRHWEALHSTCSVYRCVHCPPEQQLDLALPLTSARIISHLRMHDARLYACSGCNIYYHYQQQAVEKHITEKHSFGASVITIRQPTQTPPAVTPVLTAVTSTFTATSTLAPVNSVDSGVSAPTMDLKPWQCGLCEFKSMLRPEVVEHCGRVHNSKMQYKCAMCSWRGTLYDGVNKHCAAAHPGQSAEVLHLYYREGSVSTGPDGSPRWLYQRRLYSPNDRPAQTIAEVKLAPIVSPVDLNLVKNEFPEETETRDELSESVQSLMERYDKFCEPREGKFACPLCNVTEDSRDSMTAHLYEELNYRKWSCNMCTYKAFHKVRLMEHALHEHCQTQEPTALPADERLEAWVEACLTHQERLMRPTAAADEFVISNETPMLSSGSHSSPRACIFDLKELENAFGPFGAPKESLFSCPKCVFTVKEEEKFKDHLEYELAKVRWCCSLCPKKFHRYHEAQLHCKSVHSNPPARAVEASRDSERRAAWVTAIVRTQSVNMNSTPAPETICSQIQSDVEPEGVDNSLLVVRYEEHIAAPGQRFPRKRRPVNLVEPDSDDERLVIDECVGNVSAPPLPSASVSSSDTTSVTASTSSLDAELTPPPASYSAFVLSLPEKCPFCEYTSKVSMLEHLAKHYNLKPYVCAYCGFNGYRAALYKHQMKEHGKQPRRLLPVKLPLDLPQVRDVVLQRRCATVLCLLCGARVLKVHAKRHTVEAHPDHEAQLVDPNGVVVRCEICKALRSDEASMKLHQSVAHPDHPAPCFSNYKLPRPKRPVYVCEHCAHRFKYKRDFYAHHEAEHNGLELRFTESAASEYPVPANFKSVTASVTVPTSDSASSTLDIISCDDDEHEGSTPSEEHARSDAFSAGVVPTITAVTSLALDVAKRKLPDDFDECGAAPPLRRVAKKSTTQLSMRTNSRIRAVARKSTTQLPLYYVESDSEREETEDEDCTYSWYGRQPAALGELAHVTALMPVPVLNTLMPFTLNKLSEITNINPKVVVQDIKQSPDGIVYQGK